MIIEQEWSIKLKAFDRATSTFRWLAFGEKLSKVESGLKEKVGLGRIERKEEEESKRSGRKIEEGEMGSSMGTVNK